MDRVGCSPALTGSGEPRARGDGPVSLPVVWDVRARAPRTRGWTVDDFVALGHEVEKPRARGDGPQCPPHGQRHAERAPRTRGWTNDQRGGGSDEAESPAHAGMS